MVLTFVFSLWDLISGVNGYRVDFRSSERGFPEFPVYSKWTLLFLDSFTIAYCLLPIGYWLLAIAYLLLLLPISNLKFSAISQWNCSSYDIQTEWQHETTMRTFTSQAEHFRPRGYGWNAETETVWTGYIERAIERYSIERTIVLKNTM